jgi:hypothetical protein
MVAVKVCPMPSYSLTVNAVVIEDCKWVMNLAQTLQGTTESSFPDKTRIYFRLRDGGVSLVTRSILPGSFRSRTRMNDCGSFDGVTFESEIFNRYSINSIYDGLPIIVHPH